MCCNCRTPKCYIYSTLMCCNCSTQMCCNCIQTHKVQSLYQSLLYIEAPLYGSRCQVLQLQHFQVPHLQHFNVLQLYLDPQSAASILVSTIYRGCTLWVQMSCAAIAALPMCCNTIQTHKVQPLYQSLLYIEAALYGSRCHVLQLQHSHVLQYYLDP